MQQLQAADPAASVEFADRVIAATQNWVEKAVIGLHLLLESSVRRAAATFPGVDEIADRNMVTLRELGAADLRKLLNAER